MRVIAPLLRVRDQRRVWSHSYDRQVASVLGLQQELSADIAREVRIRLAPHPAQPSALAFRSGVRTRASSFVSIARSWTVPLAGCRQCVAPGEVIVPWNAPEVRPVLRSTNRSRVKLPLARLKRPVPPVLLRKCAAIPEARIKRLSRSSRETRALPVAGRDDARLAPYADG